MRADMERYAERFCDALEILQRKLTQDFSTQSINGLTIPQFYMLYIIREKGPCKVTALAEQLDVKPSAITVMIDRLMTQGYVTRQPDPRDRRVVLLEITDEGQQAVKRLEQYRNKVVGEYFAKLEPEETKQMIRTLEKLTEDLLRN